MSSKEQPKKSTRETIFKVLRQMTYTKLFKKYSSGNFSYDKISVNNLVFNENCLVVARFKDYLIYDDNTEFLRRYYASIDCNQRLKKILIFYETYSKIFPNYLVLKENKYLYRNIRKKQKMIDAINEIKREEKENKKRLKEKGGINGKKNLENNELFTKKVKDEIKTFQKNISFKNYKNSFDSDKDVEDTLIINQNSISISILNWNQFEKNSKMDEDNKKDWGTNIDSFITNQTNGSISGIVNVLNDNKIYTKELINILGQNKNSKIKSSVTSPLKKKALKNNKTIKKYNEVPKNKMLKKQLNSNLKEATPYMIKNNNQNKKSDKNYLLSSGDSKNLENKNKKINNKNNLYKYVKTSSNITNSSPDLPKKIKEQIASSSLNKNKLNKDKNNENNENNKNTTSNINTVNCNSNIYQKTSPKIEKFELKKHFFNTNNNFNNKVSLSKNKDNKNKENFANYKNSLDRKEKYNSNTNENIKKKYIKCKNISQDFDTNIASKVANNLLNNKNIVNTEKINENKVKKFLKDNNPNLITGDTKSNEKKNLMEDKVHVNIRDIIKNNKDMEIEKEKNNNKNKVFNSAIKKNNQKKDNLLFKISKTRVNKHNYNTRSLNLKDNKNMNSLNNIYENYNSKKNIDIIISEKDMKRNNSEFKKIKDDIKMKNKKLMTKEQKAKTKTVFNKNIFKNVENKTIKNKEKDKEQNILLKSEDKTNSPKNSQIKNEEKNNNDNNISNKKEEIKPLEDNNNKEKNNVIKKEEKGKEDKNINIEENNGEIEQKEKIVYNANSEPNQGVQTIENKNISEREMSPYLSDSNMNKYKSNLTPDKKEQKKYKAKNYIKKNNKFNVNNYINNLNNSAKIISTDGQNRFKTFLIKIKNKPKHKSTKSHSSQEEIISLNILSKMQEVKKNNTNNNFYKTLNKKISIESNNNIDVAKSIQVKNNINNNRIINKGYLIKTPVIKDRKIEFFKKNNTNRKINNFRQIKSKEDIKQKYMSSFSIKVNKTSFNKEKNQNLKKTLTKNIKNVVSQINDDIKKENKK